MFKFFMLLLLVVSAQTAPKVATYKGYEFSFYTNEASGQLTYDDAKQVCVDAGARLAEIKSPDVQGFITTQLTDLGLVESWIGWAQGYWIGGVCGGGGNPGGKNKWKWEDGTSIGGSNYDNWYVRCGITEPNGNGKAYRAFIYPFKEGEYGDQTCTGTLGTWGDDDKTTTKNWICMKMVPLTVEYKGFLYNFYNAFDEQDQLTYDAAKQVCVDDGARLAEIKSADVQDFITTQLTDLGLVENFINWAQGYWVGGVCGGGFNGKNNWKWEDGTSIGGSNYDNWFDGGGCPFSEPNDNHGSDRAFILSFEEGIYGNSANCNGALGKWGDDDKNSKKKYICMKVFLLEIEFNGLWYKFYNPIDPNDRLTYDGAKAKCKSENGHLAYIKDDDTQQMITTQLAGLNLVEDDWVAWQRGYWVGAKCVNCMGGNAYKNNWKWEDGTSIGGNNYENWYNEVRKCGPEPNNNEATSRGMLFSFDEYSTCSSALGKWGDTVDGNGAKNWICMEDLCNPNPCENEGTCNEAVNEYTCSCKAGYTGTNCKIDINECAPNPCENGGSCLDEINQFTCDCADGYTGVICETDLCNPNPCENNGTCIPLHEAYKCSCLDGFVGENCTTDLCASNPCQNGGTCNRAHDGYQCSCADGFIGEYCQIDLCVSNPCENGGTCNHAPGGYQCNCADGFVGDYCQTDLCAPNPCQHNGICVPQAGDYSCLCVDGIVGQNCETDLCDPSPCENSGTCVRKPGGKYSCSCEPAYTGTLCETASFESSENVDYLLHVNYNSFSTFSRSSEDCRSNGQSDLVIIKDAETQQNIENKASELYGQGANEFWIGAQKDDLGWSWLDGSQLTFTNWGETGNDGAGNCLKMVSQSGSSQLQWIAGQCEEQLGYICEKPANNIDPCTETECLNSGTCSSSGSHFNCQCVAGFKGVNCEIKISDPTIAIIASVVAVIVVIIIIVACVCMWKKRKSPKNVVRKKTKKQNKPSTNNAPPSEDGQIYENVGYENALFDYKISASSLLTKYLQLLADDKSKFKQQYNEKLKEVLETTESQLSDSVAKLPNNKSKNRYANIYSYDHSRVKLQTDGNESDYINAGYIDSYEGARTFIASQGPKPDTVKDFWKMIWETNSKVIVMLTNLMEKNKAKCEHYWPEPGCTLRCGSFEIQLREENEKDSYITRTFLVSQSNQSYKPRSISQLHFTTWPDHGVPSSTTGFLRFYHHVKEVMETVSGTPVTVHCSAGVGRTGTLIGFDILMAEMKKHKSVNVLETVVNMRKDRTLMVQTLEQYIFLHKLLVEVHLFGSTDFKATEINQKIKEMKRKKNDMDGFQCEYKNLDIIEPIDDSNEIASKPCNAKFNRFPGILPYDRARLILPPIQQNQPPAYYNGSMITGCPGFNGNVIAAQAPLPQHIPEFWHAVWYYDVTTIVMVTNLQQPLKILHTHSAQYWPMYEGQTDRHGAISVELKHESESIKSVIQRTILMTQDMTEKQVTQLHFQDWHENGPNPSADSILDLVRTLQETQTGNQGKVLVHCNDGAGRTGVLISVANLVERIKSENRIDVFRTVKDLRDMRPKMVTSEAQYRFIYEVCRKFVEGFATYDNFK